MYYSKYELGMKAKHFQLSTFLTKNKVIILFILRLNKIYYIYIYIYKYYLEKMKVKLLNITRFIKFYLLKYILFLLVR